MDRMRILQAGLNRVTCYQFYSSGFVLSARALNAEGIWERGWWHIILVRLTYHMLDVPERCISSTVRHSFATVRWVSVKVMVQPSSHIYPMEIRTPELMWGKMWYFLDIGVSRGFGFRYAICVAWISLPSGGITWGPLLMGWLLVQGVLTII